MNDEEKWQYVLRIIRDIDKAVYEFLLNSPDGTLRVVGPFQTKHSSFIVLSSPLPALFRFLVLNLPSKVQAIIKSDRAFVEITNKKSLLKPPSTYILKIRNAESISFNQLVHDFWMFLGVKIKPEFLLKSVKVDGIYTYVTIKTLNKDASALVNFARYAGIGENRKYGYGDTEIFELRE
jgi:hypothetical protein